MLRTAGWILAFLGFASAAWLDPWALGRDAPASFAFRQAQIAVLTMAFFLLALVQVSRRIANAPRPFFVRTAVSGAVLYGTGWALAAGFGPLPLATLGALLAGAGCAAFALHASKKAEVFPIKAALWTMTGGCVLLAITSLWTLLPNLRPAYIGPDDGLRLRLLRLAQVAAFALPSLAILLTTNAGKSEAGAAKWRRVMAWGAAGMPTVLSVAAFSSTAFKYLLPLPALAVFGASTWATLRAKKHRLPLAFIGWGVIAGSMGVGLFMGLYAFNGPVPAPPHFTDYNDFVRRLSRLGHAYLILIGLLSLFIASERARKHGPVSRKLFSLLGLGIIFTLGSSVCAAAHLAPPFALCIGPVCVTAALCLHLARPDVVTKDEGEIG